MAILPLLRPRVTLTRVSSRSLSRSPSSVRPGAVGRAGRTRGCLVVLAELADGDELLEPAHGDALGDHPAGEPVLGAGLGDPEQRPGVSCADHTGRHATLDGR